MTRLALTLLFGAILAVMLVVVTWASLDRSVFEVDPRVLKDRWFIVTLVDAYCGFLTFYAWVAYRETTWLGRGIWFVAIMTLGNLAMASYVLWRLWALPPGSGAREFLLRPTNSELPQHEPH